MEKYMSTDNKMNTYNRINGNSELYHLLAGWMADKDDPESVTDDEQACTKEEYTEYMLDQAMEIMYDIYQTCDQTL